MFEVLVCGSLADALCRCASPTTMKVLYPASHDIPSRSQQLLAIKIARHSSCSSCSSCSGLRPPPDVEVAPDSETQPSSSPTDAQGNSGTEPYLLLCSCTHDVAAHGADLSLVGAEEFARRGRVAVRLDELLEVGYCCTYVLPDKITISLCSRYGCFGLGNTSAEIQPPLGCEQTPRLRLCRRRH